jgi:hypothetical protein
MSKFIEINDSGYVWVVPLEVIADNRATYYAEDGYNEEFNFTMNDGYEALDWFLNNMNFSDVSGEAKLVKVPPQKLEPDMYSGTTTTSIVEVE